ncbi:patatin-domain-containing protein [Polychaeton citri CBS 116435]|uniref:Patatin-like phospholipase domain-containing protein n=1 Tax=Polychaeton citri CBS 116435 TaxID=1314669 RepID=A0A9P4Q430_9PEZI|nr:patatin-domain-containing protein [Polychaeton citri CBS 116435]
MDYVHSARIPGFAGLGHSVQDEWDSDRSQKKLRKSKSHASIVQPLLRAVRDPFETLGSIAESLGYNWGSQDGGGLSSEEARERQLLLLRLQGAQSLDEWRKAAVELDRIEGNDAWKAEEQSAEYDVELVKGRLLQFDEARVSADSERMLFLIRTALTRDLGGMGNLRLYKHSRIGTKVMIEKYIESVLATLNSVVSFAGQGGERGLDARHVLEQMLAARQAFGRSALLLSGGGTFGMNHIGVVKALWQVNLLPRIISGASAGSIVCAMLCTRTDAEIPQFVEEIVYGDLEVFTRSGQEESILTRATRFLKYGAIYDISNLVRVMKDMLGDITFQEAYNRTRRILNICVSSASLYELPRLLNYITAPNVMIWSAVAASCSVPFIFSAAQLLAKDPKTGQEVPWNASPQRWIDGSVDNDLPMTRLAEMFNVNHFIVSQVNPHVVPFLAKEEAEIEIGAQRSTASMKGSTGWTQTLASLAKGEALHRMHTLTEVGFLPTAMTKLRSVLGQKYSGDITIFPDIAYADFPIILTNPTQEFMISALAKGERATWPKMSRIRNHCAVELALDDAVQKLRARVVFSPSQVDLRINSFGTTAHTEHGPSKRRGSKGSHKSSRSHVIARERPGRRLVHRSIKSWHDHPSTVPAVPSLKVPGPDSAGYFSSAGSEDEASSSTLTPDSEGDFDESESVRSESSYTSPPSPHPQLWPSTRQLFPSVSQPATPSVAARMPAPSPAASSRASAASKEQGHPPVRVPSSPELKYKRLFHNVRPMETIRSQAGTPEATPSDDQAPRLSRKSSKFGLHLDISGTRGMVRRRKRSLSTGLKGLWPPGKQ